ncbi:HK97 family phage prohead protease [Streptomyces olivoreticuli]
MTGVVDEVNDLIMPGAFAHTLATRPVKTVWHHEWKEPVGVVLDIAEWQPGDQRFAGIPNWPAAAGALVATIQFNLRTSRGRDTYEQVRQWHMHGQAQFSIGYRVPPSGATRRNDGVRIIHKLDLYEISPVLHGAHPMTRSLEVKADPAAVQMEHKTTCSTGRLQVKAPEPHANGVMIALYPPPEVAAQVAHPDGSAPEDLHITLAYLGDDELGGNPDDLPVLVRTAVEGTAPLSGSIGGIGQFPDSGDGVPTWIPVDVPGLAELRQQVADRLSASPFSGALRADHGFLPHVTLGYELPDVPPASPVPVHFDQVYVVRGADRIPIPLAGPPSEPDQSSAPQPPTEGKSARATVAAAKAIRSRQMEHKSARATVAEAKSRILPGDTMTTAFTPQPLPESYEQLRSRLSDSVRDLLGKDDGTWTCIEATYPDRVLVTVQQDGGESTTFAVPYQANSGDITLGTPEPVELATIVIPEGADSHRAATGAEDVDARVVQPTVDAITDATARISATAADAHQLEGVRSTIEELLEALSAKGLDVGAEGPEEEAESIGRPSGGGIDLWDDDTFGEDGTGDENDDEAGEGTDEPAPGDSIPDGTVLLNADEVKAQLAAMRL